MKALGTHRGTGVIAAALLAMAGSAGAQTEGSESLTPSTSQARAAPGVVILEFAEDEPPLQPVPHPPSEEVAVPPPPEGYGATPAPAPGNPPQPYGQPYGPQTYGPPPVQQRVTLPRYHREPYVDGTPIPEGGQITSRARMGMWISGIALLGAGYLMSVITWTVADDWGGSEPKAALTPLIGPFFLFAEAERAGRFWLTLMGGIQIAGLTLILVGALVRQQYLVWYGDSGIRLSPAAGRQGGGLQMAYDF